jgi:hypothetical protein
MPEEKYLNAALIVGYLRPTGIIKTLQKIIESGIENIYVAIDGPKIGKPNDVAKTVLEEIEKIQNSKNIIIKTWIRDANLGLAVSMITAIDWFFQFEELGIVLEDDLDFNENLVVFFRSNSHVLKNPKIMMLSGNNFSSGQIQNDSLITYPLIWGWCTDAMRWRTMRELILSPKIQINFKHKLFVSTFWFAGSLKSRFGNLDSWALPLAAGFHLNSYYCLIPSENLVKNVGYDEFATHTSHFIRDASLEISGHNNKASNASTIHHWEPTLDYYLERNIYQIRTRNLFSPVKVLVEIFFYRGKKHLKKRVSKVILPT